MREKDLTEGLGDLAHRAEQDHEVQMARAELYKLAKYAIKLHEMLKNVSEQEGLEGWVQSKITKSAEMIGSVYHHLDYQEATGELGDGVPDDSEEVAIQISKNESKQTIKVASLQDRLQAKLAERSLTKGETKKKEKYVKGMKKSDSFKKYDDPKAVMYATATKMAKKKG